MKTFKQFINEAHHDSFILRPQKHHIDVYKNPTSRELNDCISSENTIRGFIHNDDFYSFNPEHVEHHSVRTNSDIPTGSIPVHINHDKKTRTGKVTITDEPVGMPMKNSYTTKNKNKILNHPELKKHYKKHTVDFG